MKYQIILASAVLILSACAAAPTPSSSSSTSTSGTAAAVSETTTTSPSGVVTTLADVHTAVVRIVAHGSFYDAEDGAQYNTAGSGSGFIVTADGLAVTNNHVVAGAAYLDVYVDGESTARSARILGVSECSDLAVIDIDGDGYRYLTWSDGQPTAGTAIYVAGFPLGDAEFTLQDGIVSKAKADGDSDWASVSHVIEHSADVLPGSSGGPVVTTDGTVVGVNYAGDNDGQAFAIASAEATPILDQLENGEDVTSLGLNGQAFAAEDTSGIFVNAVVSGSPADDAGIKAGDIISLIEGIEPASDGTMADYCKILRSHQSGDPISIEVYRYDDDTFYEGTLNTGNQLEATWTDPGTSVTGQTVYYLNLVPGQCFNDDGIDSDSFNITLTDCDSPHDNEVYSTLSYPQGSYPGYDEFGSISDSDCLDQFADYVGVDYSSSRLLYESLWAGADDWDGGDRSAICILYDVNWDPITGSVYHTGY